MVEIVAAQRRSRETALDRAMIAVEAGSSPAIGMFDTLTMRVHARRSAALMAFVSSST